MLSTTSENFPKNVNIPEISVLMTTYNSEKWLTVAVESILSQSFTAFEFLILDDGSKDSTLQLLKDLATKDARIKLYQNDNNRGIAFSLNKLLAEASTDIIAIADSDDVSYTNRLEVQYDLLQSKPSLAICYSDQEIINDSGKVLGIRTYLSGQEALKNVFKYTPVPNSTVMFRKSILTDLQGYKEQYNYAPDTEFWLRACKKYEFQNVGKVLMQYRIHDTSNIHKPAHVIKCEYDLFKIRWYAFTRLGYTPTFQDVIFNLAEIVGVFLIPLRFKIYLYEKMRIKKLI